MVEQRNTGGADVLNIVGVAALVGCTQRHVRKLVERGEFPAPARLGALTRWSRAAVLEWLAARTGATTERGGRAVRVRG